MRRWRCPAHDYNEARRYLGGCVCAPSRQGIYGGSMNATAAEAGNDRPGEVVVAPKTPSKRLVGIDTARGLALAGMMATHLLPAWNETTGDATLSWRLFSGNAAALFALLAGVGLALSTGGRHPHEGRRMTANRAGIAVRAILISLVGLWIGTLMPANPPAYNILIYYGVFFLLAIPFLRVGPRMLFVSAAIFALGAPLLMQNLLDVLPNWSSYNPTLGTVLAEPGPTAAQLLLTGNYPALQYMTFLLTGMGIGRLNLREIGTQVRILVVGVGVAVLAHLTSYILLYGLGGYQRLLESSGLRASTLKEWLTWGPDGFPTGTPWWLAITTPHTDTPLALAASLGVAMGALGGFLLIARKVGAWLLPLTAMGIMTLTIYTAHLVALSFEVHYDRPYLWYMIHLGVAAAFAMAWYLNLGKGPLERVIGYAVTGARRIVLGGAANNPEMGASR